MSYSMIYSLDIIDPSGTKDDDQLIRILEAIDNLEDGTIVYDLTTEEIKYLIASQVMLDHWDYQKELKYLSIDFPSALFRLECRDPETGKIWRYYAKNGRTTEISGEVVFLAFEERMLE